MTDYKFIYKTAPAGSNVEGSDIPSRVGHAWFEVVDNQGNIKSFGLSPSDNNELKKAIAC